MCGGKLEEKVAHDVKVIKRPCLVDDWNNEDLMNRSQTTKEEMADLETFSSADNLAQREILTARTARRKPSKIKTVNKTPINPDDHSAYRDDALDVSLVQLFYAFT
jgi:hypothetical protein